jgi:hypothetical protein
MAPAQVDTFQMFRATEIWQLDQQRETATQITELYEAFKAR